MKKILQLAIVSLMVTANLYGQNYLGGGNDSGITVQSSSALSNPDWPKSCNGENTINDDGLKADYFEACRFLEQATIGYTPADVQSVMALGFEGWIDNQLNIPASDFMYMVDTIFQIVSDTFSAENPNSDPLRRPGWTEFNYAWWEYYLNSPDLLRQKVAAALSEILVLSRLSDLGQYGDGMAYFYQQLLSGALGNYRAVLDSVTYNPSMGFYLTYLNNPKSDIPNDIHPDENYAREVMQLFTIGLYELNPDGSHKIINGAEVPTYDNNDIKELAKVFTGLGVGDVVEELTDDVPGNWDDEAYFGMGLWVADMEVPMQMWDWDDPATPGEDEDQHEDGIKIMLDGTVIPAGQTGEEDIADALDVLFAHDNLGPFMAYRLIQRLVKSNPSPAYVSRMSAVFSGQGSAARGDLGALVKAILLDPEARDCSYQMDDANAKLKEPLFRYTHFVKNVERSNPYNYYWNVNYSFFEKTSQDILASPSVFNFFLYDDRPNGPIADQGLVAPEFKIHDSRTSVGYMNAVYNATFNRSLMNNWVFDYPENTTFWEYQNLLPIENDDEALINWVDHNILGGKMKAPTRRIIRRSLGDVKSWMWQHERRKIALAVYLAMISPDYTIMN